MSAKSLFEKLWDRHIVVGEPGTLPLLYVDRQLVYEVTSPQAFEGLRQSGRRPRRPSTVLATCDHNVPTTSRAAEIAEPLSPCAG
jgi:3-isopropylmalate/(R)-2-methylmalate dehydratase large subunit